MLAQAYGVRGGLADVPSINKSGHQVGSYGQGVPPVVVRHSHEPMLDHGDHRG